jgi:hypothetical protein
LKIMKTNNKGWDYCGNAQVVVDDVCQIILACDVTAASNDKEQAVPLAEAVLANLERAGIARPTQATGQPLPLPNLTDSGYYSAKAARGVQALGLDPYMATERQRHHAAAASAGPAATAKEAMAAKLRTQRRRGSGLTRPAASAAALRARLGCLFGVGHPRANRSRWRATRRNERPSSAEEPPAAGNPAAEAKT